MSDTRYDPQIGGMARRCTKCHEWWPDDADFYYEAPSRSNPTRQCRACIAEQKAGRPTPLRPKTHGTTIDIEAKRARDRERKAALRRDPILGDKLRERQRLAQQRFYERNKPSQRARMRAYYERKRGHPPRPGLGRPRLDDAA